MRPVNLKAIGMCDLFSDLDAVQYALDPEGFLATSDNWDFDLTISGTANVTELYDANAFISNGHYIGLDRDAMVAAPVIIDPDQSEVHDLFDRDQTMYVIESVSGRPVMTSENFFLNFVIPRDDDLFKIGRNDSEYGLFLPMLLTKRENMWSEDTL